MDNKQTKTKKMNDRDHAALLMLYEVTIDDIERAKRWGWIVTYATIAAQGAILGLFHAYNNLTYLDFIGFIFLVPTIGLAILAIFLIKDSQDSLETFRTRLKDVRSELGKENNKFNEFFKEDENKKRIWPLNCVVLLSTIFVCLLIILSNMNTLNGYLCISSTTIINSFGLILSTSGAVLLLFSGLPVQVMFPGITGTSGQKWEFPKKYQKKISRNKVRWMIGLCLLFAGFLLQLFGNLNII